MTIDVLILIQIPIGNIGIVAFAPAFAIGSEGDNFVLTFQTGTLTGTLNRTLTGTEILVGVCPGIFRKFWQISTELPLLWDHPDRRFFDQGFQSLFSRGID